MDVSVFVEPQVGAHYADVLRVAQRAEQCGYAGFFVADHYLKSEDFLQVNPGGHPGPTDAWLTLAALSQATTTIQLGTLMSAATFRLPASLAISAAQVDQMSGGRLRLGVGAGWFEQEHHAYGIPFPPLRERFDRLEEQLEIITGMWATEPGETFHHNGNHYELADSPALPKPLQRPRPPILVGGIGTKRTPAIAARFADEYNIPFVDGATAADRFGRLADACGEFDRDPAEIVRSATHATCIGRDPEELQRRADAIGAPLEVLRGAALAGTPSEVADTIGNLRERTGIRRLYLQIQDLRDIDHIELVAQDVLPQLD